MSAECQTLLFELPLSPASSSSEEKAKREPKTLRLVSGREVKTMEEPKAQPVQLKGRLTVSF